MEDLNGAVLLFVNERNINKHERNKEFVKERVEFKGVWNLKSIKEKGIKCIYILTCFMTVYDFDFKL